MPMNFLTPPLPGLTECLFDSNPTASPWEKTAGKGFEPQRGRRLADVRTASLMAHMPMNFLTPPLPGLIECLFDSNPTASPWEKTAGKGFEPQRGRRLADVRTTSLMAHMPMNFLTPPLPGLIECLFDSNPTALPWAI
jgi:hypothetical protein